MTNIRSERRKCRDECPTYGDGTAYSSKGDVLRCKHDRLFVAMRPIRWDLRFDNEWWRRLTPTWAPIRYRRALRLLAVEETSDD